MWWVPLLCHIRGQLPALASPPGRETKHMGGGRARTPTSSSLRSPDQPEIRAASIKLTLGYHSSLRYKWGLENDQGCFSDDQWKHALQSIYRSTKWSALWELTQKITLRWYLTPAILASFNPQTSKLCWRCKSSKGDMLHTFWACPYIQTYWDNTFKLISTVTKRSVLPTPELAVLNLTIDDIPSPL